ncbi:hypothetical protein JCM10207_004481 [Rhodosporidiobolus poonsookiae]
MGSIAPPPASLPPTHTHGDTAPLQNDFPTPSLSRTATRTSTEQFEIEDGTEGQGQALPPVDRGRGAWGFVAAAFLLETFIWGYSYSFATILVYFETHEPWRQQSIATLSAVGTTQLGIQFIFPLFFTVVFRRYPDYIKPVLWVSVAVNCGSMLISSWATQVWQLIVLQGILCGVTGAALYTPVFLWMSEWWLEKRGLASGIIFSGTGAGGFAFPFAITALLQLSPTPSSNIGFQWMCRVWALTTLVVFSVSLWLIGPRVKPPKRGTVKNRTPWMAGAGEIGIVGKSGVFWTMVLAALLSSLSTLPVSLNIGLYSSSLTSSALKRELSVSLFNLAASLGCFVTGYLSDFSYAHATTMCGLAGAVLALAAWGTANSLAKVYAFAVVFGFFSQQVAAWSASARDVVGPHQNPHTATLVFCLYSVVRGIASVCMPFVSDTLYVTGKEGIGAAWGAYGFRKMIIFVGVAAFLSAIGGIGLHYVQRAVRDKRRRAALHGAGK